MGKLAVGAGERLEHVTIREGGRDRGIIQKGQERGYGEKAGQGEVSGIRLSGA